MEKKNKISQNVLKTGQVLLSLLDAAYGAARNVVPALILYLFIEISNNTHWALKTICLMAAFGGLFRSMKGD